jgi:hypothetical protein
LLIKEIRIGNKELILIKLLINTKNNLNMIVVEIYVYIYIIIMNI